MMIRSTTTNALTCVFFIGLYYHGHDVQSATGEQLVSWYVCHAIDIARRERMTKNDFIIAREIIECVRACE